VNIPVKVFSTGAIEFMVDAGSAPVDVSYTGTTFSSGFVLASGEGVMLASVTQSGNLALTSLGGVSRISAKFSSAEAFSSDGFYSLSREIGQHREILGTFYIKK